MEGEGAYVPIAQDFLLQCAQQFFTDKFLFSVSAVRQQLSDLLTETNEFRCHFLQSCYDCIKEHQESVTEDFYSLETRITQACRQLDTVRQRGKVWLDLAQQHAVQAHKGLFKRFVSAVRKSNEEQQNQRTLIILHSSPEENIPERLTTLHEVVDWYAEQLSTIQKDIESLRSRQKKLAMIREKHKTLQDSLVLMFDKLRSQFPQVFTKTTSEYLSFLKDEQQKDEQRFQEIDNLVDISLRMKLFWLAVHYYECVWLEVCQGGTIIPEKERYQTTANKQQIYWSQLAALFPCAVMTAYHLPAVFGLYTKEGQPAQFDFERIDLLVVDEAGQVDTAIGLATLAFAKRAVIVGDVNQLAPIWAYSTEEDRELAGQTSLSDVAWEALKLRGLTASAPSSLMRAAVAVCPWKYGDSEGGLLLTEHYRCYPEIIKYCNALLYRGRLEAKRISAAEDDKNPLRKLPCAFALHIVEESVSKIKGSSRINPAEAREIVDWIVRNHATILQSYEEKQPGAYTADKVLGVVTPFSAQAQLIRRLLSEKAPDLARLGMKIGTAHVLQGAECPVILFSSVYGNNDGEAGFIEKNPELMNVAVSRAKDCFIVFCSQNRTTSNGKVLGLMFRYARPMQDLEGIIVDRDIALSSSIQHKFIPTFDRGVQFETTLPTKPELNQITFAIEPIVSAKETLSDTICTSSSLSTIAMSTEEALSVTAWLKRWKQDPTLTIVHRLNAKEVNNILLQLGWLREDASGNKIPSQLGIKKGLKLTTGYDSKQSSSYAYSLYTVKAAKNLLEILLKICD